MPIWNKIKEIIKNYTLTGVLVGLAVYLFGFITAKWLHGTSINLFFAAIDVPVGGQSMPAVGNSFVQWLRLESIPIVPILISAVLLVYIGRLIWEVVPVWRNNKFKKMWVILLFGAIVGRLLIGGIASIPFNNVGAWIAFAIYWALVSLMHVIPGIFPNERE
jgi:hypothetical protein